MSFWWIGADPQKCFGLFLSSSWRHEEIPVSVFLASLWVCLIKEVHMNIMLVLAAVATIHCIFWRALWELTLADVIGLAG